MPKKSKKQSKQSRSRSSSSSISSSSQSSISSASSSPLTSRSPSPKKAIPEQAKQEQKKKRSQTKNKSRSRSHSHKSSKEEEWKVHESDLIPALQEDLNYLQSKYNEVNNVQSLAMPKRVPVVRKEKIKEEGIKIVEEKEKQVQEKKVDKQKDYEKEKKILEQKNTKEKERKKKDKVIEDKKEKKVIEDKKDKKVMEDKDRVIEQIEEKQKEESKIISEKTQLQPIVVQKPRPQMVISRTGGVYIPPHKLQQLQDSILNSEKKYSLEHQRLMWELLRKSINGVINKVNISNIQNVLIELLNENILRGKGLLARAIIKAQMASPNFTHVYTALIAVINTKLPEIVQLIINRVVLQFQRAFKRNIKIVCMATTKMMAHLINQQVLSDFVGLQLITLLLENPTEDSVEIACDFMKEAGQMLTELTPPGVNAIFERFKGILHEGEIDKKVQYSIENLFAIRKTKFKDYPGVIPELDLVEQEDQITHEINLDDTVDGEERINIFLFDPFFEKTEEEWTQIKQEILGEENIIRLKNPNAGKELLQQLEQESDMEEEEKVEDFTEKDLVNLRRTIYLAIMNSVDFESCAHKLIQMGIAENKHEDEVCNMFVECCLQERTYIRFFGLLAQRFSQLYDIYRELLNKLFIEKYETIHRYTTNKIRNLAKFFSHLLSTNAMDWSALECVVITQEKTTSSSRIFIKIMFQDLAEQLGLEKLATRLSEEDVKPHLDGLFPKDSARNMRFSINFFTSIGLGLLTEELREELSKAQEINIENMQNQKSENSSSSDSSSDSSSNDSSSESSSSSESD